MEKTIAILGSTGSIGTQALQVCRGRGFRVGALTAHSNVKLLEQQVREFRPALAVIADESQYGALRTALADLDVRLAAGRDAVCEAAAREDVDTVLNSLVGIAGLRPTLTALQAGKALALANKESLITGGSLVMDAAKENGAPLLPVDSEHSAIWQCLHAGRREEVRGVILTASGGPFFGKSRGELEQVDLGQALAHPNWSMGAKITIDSATMMNKGLEFIEAMWLFDLVPEQIEVVVHRQSIVHSAVEYRDGAVIAQMGVPDMRGAIQYALTYPERDPLEVPRLSLTELGLLTFERPDPETFTCLSACIRAAQMGGLSPCVANGANEQAVELFRQKKISFLRIGELVNLALDGVVPSSGQGLDAIEEIDRAAREFVLTHF